jgi:catechol 2,3-dioxygenase-like lactoylglutathione lyase family enzyme
VTLVGAHHTGFQVSDIERSVAFYTELLGMELIGRRTITEPYIGDLVGYPGVELRSAYLRMGTGEHTLELIEYRNVERTPVDPQTANPGTAHICLVVDENLGKLHQRLRDAGTETMSAEPVRPTRGQNVGKLVAYIADPDGIRIELIGS